MNMAGKKTFTDIDDNVAAMLLSGPKPEPQPEQNKQEKLERKEPVRKQPETKSRPEAEPASDNPHDLRYYGETKSRRLQVLIRPSTLDSLKKIAKRKQTSVNDLINILLEEAIRKS